jgi:protein-export SecD/SecF family membrane protein
MRRFRRSIPGLLIILMVVLLINFDRPGGPNIKIGSWEREMTLHKGLDLVGGSHLVFALDTSNYSGNKTEALSQVEEIMRLRVDALGVSEPILQRTTVGDENAIIVELPGIDDTAKARSVIGQTAQLMFIDPNGQTVLTGADVDRADVTFNQTTNQPQVQLTLKESGKIAFATATKNNVGQPIYIILDDQLISAPTVNEEIPNGIAIISGIGDGQTRAEAAAEVRQLTRQINSGALPVPVQLVEEQTVGATLGGNVVRHTIAAGVVAFLAICVFLILVYGLAGIVTSLTLVVYALLMLFFIQFIPITMTLAGLAALILSFGSAVDANILTFSRLKEELRHQSDPELAVRQAFERAWSSVRDSNLASVIISLVLLWFGTGPIRGFALILLLGVAMAIFSALYVSRHLLTYLARTRLRRHITTL